LIKLKFEYDQKSDWLLIKPLEDKYRSIELIGNKHWQSDRVKEDIEWAKQCKEGTFNDENGNDGFDIGFEGSPGLITVFNDLGGFVTGQYDDKEYLRLTFDEVLDILQQMYDFLKSIGK
jgi:hypothetical protein